MTVCYRSCLFLLLLATISAHSADTFDFKVLAQSGQAGIGSIKSSPNLGLSFNDKGQAAFVVSLAGGGEGVFVADGVRVANLSPSYSSNTISPRIQMNNNGIVATRFSGGITPPKTAVGTWDTSRTNALGTVDYTGGTPGKFCAGGDNNGQPCDSDFNCYELLPDGRITYWDCRSRPYVYATFLNPAINDWGQVAYLGTKNGNPQTNDLISVGPLGEFKLPLVTPNHIPKLVLANNGRAIGRLGDAGSPPIRLFEKELTNYTDIATSADYSQLGQNPGLSDSGELAAFYGNRISDGQGIFVYYVTSNELVRVASVRTNSPDDPNIVSGFSQDSRVSINNDGVVLFQGINVSGLSAIFRTVVRYCNNNQTVVQPTKQVIAVGDTIPGLSGTIQSLAIYDSLNNEHSGEIAFLATMPGGIQAIVKAIPKACDVCSTCIAGQKQERISSVDITLGLGASKDGSVSSSLRIFADTPTVNLATPAGLSLTSGGYSQIRSNGALRQVKGQILADILVDTPYRYQILFYTNSGPFSSGTGLFPPLGGPFSTITVENPDGATSTNRLQVTRNNADLSTYVFHPEYNGWELIRGFGNAARKESLERATNGVQRTETRVIRDGTNNVLSKVRSLYESFAWGEELIQTIEDPDGAAHTTTYGYYTNSVSDGNNYGHLRSTVSWNGHWEFYQQYHPVYGLTKSVSQFQNNPYSEMTNWPNPDNRSSEVSQIGNLETRTEYLKGHPISRRWHNELAPGYTIDAVATNPSATNWWDTSNLITTNLLYLTSNTNGAKAGQTAYAINPDGTMSLHAYYDEFIPDPTHSGGGAPLIETLRTVTWSGAANSNFTQVIDGTVSEEVTDISGNFFQRREWDIASSVLTASESVATRDAFGRPTRINYLDGTYTTRIYDCCGLAQQTDREGIVTTYNTDHTVLLDLIGGGGPETYYGSTATRAGISTHTLTDALGRAFKTILQGTNGNLIVQDERHYNVLGELDWSKDALGRTTTYSNAYVGGFTINTTTFPDGSQSIGTSWQDGSAYETEGDAVQGLRYVTDVVQDNGVWVQTSTQTRLETNGVPSAEYTTTFTDFAGRVYKTQYPWPDGGTNVFSFSEYNSKGQLYKTTDPDNVATLYQYNSSGELQTTATDMANPGVIDFGGTDRITRTRSSVTNTSSHGIPVRLSTTEIWESDNLNQPTVLQLIETSLDGTTNWATQYGLTTRTETAIDRLNQRRTATAFNPDGTRSVSVFELGRQASITRYDSNSVQISRATFAYDAFGRLASETDARNGATLYTYYDDGQIHTVITPDPDPGATGPGYNPQTNSYVYFRDPVNGIKTVTTLPDGGNVTQQFYPSGQLKKTWGARTYPAAYTYDRAGRVDTLTTWQQFNFNTGNGLSGAATTRWHYNSRALLAFKEYADGKGPTYTYTAGGKLKTRLWARGVSTTYGYDPKSGDLLTLNYSDSTPAVTNAYDRLGRLKNVMDASGTRQFGYQYGQTTTEAYTVGMFAGITLQRGLDGFNRLQSLTVTNPAVTLYQVGYGYDAASRLRTVTSGPDVATYSYHTNADLVNTLVQTHSNQVRLTTTKLYDKLNRLQSITSVPSADSPISFAYQYNDANQRTRATLANGEYWTYGYDALGQVTNGVKRFSNNAPIPGYSFGYQFDHIGNRLAATRDNRTDAYTNNVLNQIQSINYAPWLHVLGQVNSNATITVNGQTPVRTNGYFYTQLATTSIWNNVNIQASVVGAATNGANALAEETGHVFNAGSNSLFQQDDDGNLTADGRWIYTWDGENRLVEVTTRTNLSASGIPRIKLKFTTDSGGRRIARVLDSFDSDSQDFKPREISEFVYDRAIPLFTITENEGGNQAFTWGLDISGDSQGAAGVGGLLSVKPSNTANDAWLTSSDGNGNVGGLASGSSGSLVAEYEYGAFGESLGSIGRVAEINRFRFSTKYNDPATQLIHFENRYYSPKHGSFLTRDPLEEREREENLFNFVANDPINDFDILGLLSWKNAKDVWVIQTILNNNAKELDIHLGISGKGFNGIDGIYGPKTTEAVCRLQQRLKQLGLMDTSRSGGLWDSVTDEAFERAEQSGLLNWRYSHLRLGLFAGLGGKAGWGSWGFGIEGSIGAHSHISRSEDVNRAWGAIVTKSKVQGGILEGNVIVTPVMAWNIFNSDDWRALGGKPKKDWGFAVGPMKERYAKILGKSGKFIVKRVEDAVTHKNNVKDTIKTIRALAGDKIWEGEPDALAFSFPIGLGVGGWWSADVSSYYTTDFEFGN